MLPPYPTLAPFVTEAEDAQGRPIVQLPRQLFELLLREAARALPFDVATYLQENVDVAARHATDPDFSPREHFLRAGYREGRRPAGLPVDAAWYLKTYLDIAQSIARGRIASAEAHFNAAGWAECRAPNAAEFEAMEAWQGVIAELRD